jgi:DNA-binding NarL/FixJ family response regulator
VSDTDGATTPAQDGNIERISVVLVDDHAVLRQALRMLLSAQRQVEVVADVGNGREAIEAVERHRPDVVVMDLVMPGLSGVEATRQIRRTSPTTRVIVLSGFVDERQIIDSMRAGASGYVIKRSDIEELVSEALTQGFDLQQLEIDARKPEPRSGSATLTTREREVLQLVAEGATNQGVANSLSISIKTVESHIAHIMDKLHARNRGELIRQAIQQRLVTMETPDLATLDLPPLGTTETRH